MAPKLDKSKLEAAFERARQAASPADGVSELWTLIEPALEEKGLYQTEIRGYLDEKTKDLRSWRKSRFWAMVFTVTVVALTVFSGMFILFCPWSPLQLGDDAVSDNVQIAVLAGHFLIIFGLTALIMRGAFTPAKDDTPVAIPESAKILSETLSSILAKH